MKISELKDKVQSGNKEIFTLDIFQEKINQVIEDCQKNKVKISEVPVLVYNTSQYDTYNLESLNFGFRTKILKLCFCNSDIIDFDSEDIRPEYGEYWASRGPSNFDCSGFIKSKQAGIRLLRYVKAILEKDETESWLDYRKFEPNWIQFKFSAEEFDVVKLDKLCKENNNIITFEIMYKCALKNKTT